jgi:acetyltransferase-like isoleucine patch superfamily enzyme
MREQMKFLIKRGLPYFLRVKRKYSLPIVCSKKVLIDCDYPINFSLKGLLTLGLRDFGLSPNDEVYLKMLEGGSICIRGPVSIGQGTKINIYENAKLSINERSFITGKTNIICCKEITIGSDCAISWNVQIMDSDLHQIEDQPRSAAIHISDRVWIGTNVTILKGVKIGSDSIIGANSLVNKDIPSHCVAAGNPAKVIRSNISGWKI